MCIHMDNFYALSDLEVGSKLLTAQGTVLVLVGSVGEGRYLMDGVSSHPAFTKKIANRELVRNADFSYGRFLFMSERQVKQGGLRGLRLDGLIIAGTAYLDEELEFAILPCFNR